MDVTIQELKPRALRLELAGTSAAQVNAIRRILLSDLPKLAIDEVEFHLGMAHYMLGQDDPARAAGARAPAPQRCFRRPAP